MNIIEMLKADFSIRLEKKGSSLEELEKDLSNIKEGQLEKSAGVWDFLKEVVGGTAHGIEGAGSLLSGGLGTSIMLGTAGGGALYAADHHLQDQDKMLAAKQQEVDRVKSITGRLKNDYGLA